MIGGVFFSKTQKQRLEDAIKTGVMQSQSKSCTLCPTGLLGSQLTFGPSLFGIFR
jgi:hypothetical protein